MTTTCKQVLAVATTAIAHCPSPKRWRIVGPSRESRRESSEDSAEGEDRRRCRYDKGRTRQRQRQSAGCEGNGLLTTTAMGSGESGRGRTTKANDESGRPRRQQRHHHRQQWLCPPLETTINKRRGDERGDGDEMHEKGGGTHDNRGERTRQHNNQIDHKGQYVCARRFLFPPFRRYPPQTMVSAACPSPNDTLGAPSTDAWEQFSFLKRYI